MNRGQQPVQANTRRQPSAEGRAGSFLLLTAAATLLMVYARVAADADRPELLESLRAISDNRGMYTLTGAARLISGLTLFAGAWFLWRTELVQGVIAKRTVAALFAISGAFTADSGISALLLSGAAPEAAASGAVNSFTESVSFLRWLTGKLGFAAAGLALAAVALDRWKTDGGMKAFALASAVIGVMMQLIWIDAATIVHRIVGVAFFWWLVVTGVMLLRGRLGQTPDLTGGIR